MKPKFSIIICNYNYEKFVGNAIFSAINQFYDKNLFEVIVVDDGSTDGSMNVLNAYSDENGVKIIRKENGGQLSAFLTGLGISQYEWICLLDSDDIFLTHKLISLCNYIDNADVRPLFICHDLWLLDSITHKRQGWMDRLSIDGSALSIDDVGSLYPFSVPCGQVYHRSILEALMDVIPAAEWMRGADNPLLWSALFITGKVHYIHHKLAVYLAHGGNHFTGTGENNFAPKFSWLERWPKLLSFLNELVENHSDLFIGHGDRRKLMQNITTQFSDILSANSNTES